MTIAIQKSLIPGTHNERVILTDTMGVVHEMIIPLVVSRETSPAVWEHVRTDPDAEIRKVVEMMEAREKIAMGHAQARGLRPVVIATADQEECDTCG